MTIKVTYNVTDVYVTQDVSPVYINVSYSTGGGSGAAVWGSITGTLSDQTDLQSALDAKFDEPTGTTAQYLRGDGSLATFPTITSGTVTSVGLTMPSAFSVANSPVTSSGTIAVTGAGDTTQYIAGDGSLATFPSLTGYVPYTGATANVDLGTHTIIAQNATIASSGSGDTATITHSSGSGIALNITKGGNGEGLYINKTSGSGNAATIIGTINATTLVKSGGTSSQFLKADGSVDSSVYVPTSTTLTINGVTYDLSANRSWTVAAGITGSGASGQVAYWTGASSQSGSNNLFWDAANSRLLIGGGANTGERLQVTGDVKITGGGTGATNSLSVLNSGGVNLFRVRNDQQIFINSATNFGSVQFYPINNGAYAVASNATELRCETTFVNGRTTGSFGFYFFTNYAHNTSSPNPVGIIMGGSFLPTSGTQTFVSLSIESLINQTGGANGITRGILLNPVLTSAANWRSIEWTNNSGWGIYGEGTANNYLGGNLLLGSRSNSGERLQVTGDVKIVGSGNTSATNALRVLNSSSSVLLTARNDGEIFIGAGGWLTIASGQRYIYKNLNQTSILSIANDSQIGSTLDFYGTSHATKPRTVSLVSIFNPTSGSIAFSGFEIVSTINQQGGANGITRGLYVNPTLTAAADFRAIETTNGKVIFGNLPTSSAGLPTGAIWNDAGTIKIV